MSMLAMGGKAKRDTTSVANSFDLLRDSEDVGASREAGQREKDGESRAIIGEDGNMLNAKMLLGNCAKIVKSGNKQSKRKKGRSADESMESFMKSSHFVKLLGTNRKDGEVVVVLFFQRKIANHTVVGKPVHMLFDATMDWLSARISIP